MPVLLTGISQITTGCPAVGHIIIVMEDNILDNNFFGIYIQNGKNCIVRNNKLRAYAVKEQQIGNGIHAWKSENLEIENNEIIGHRDGIYFEFVYHSIIKNNKAKNNLRYGL